MVESSICPRCSAAVLPGHAFCGKCGAPLPFAIDPGLLEVETVETLGTDATDASSATGRGRARARGKASPEAADQTSRVETTAAVAETASVSDAASTPETQSVTALEPDAVDPRLAALGLAPAAAADPSPVSAGAWAAALAPEPTPAHTHMSMPMPVAAPMPVAPPMPVAAPMPSVWPVPAEHPFVTPAVDSVEPADQAPLEAAEEPPARVAGGYLPPAEDRQGSPWTLRPSTAGSTGRVIGPSLSASVGAVPVSSLGDGAGVETDVSAQRSVFAGSSQFGTPVEVPSDPVGAPLASLGALAATPDMAYDARPPQPATVAAAVTAQATTDAADATVAPKESTRELIAFGLVAGGAVVGMASMFLPWGNGIDGAGIGINAAHSSPSEWGWSMPIAIPIFLLSGLVLGAASGSDRAKERLPKLAPIIGQVTDMIIPMILGGLYLGVVLMAATYPWGFGGGVLAMLLAAGLLIGGAVVTLFSPAEVLSVPK